MASESPVPYHSETGEPHFATCKERMEMPECVRRG